MRFIGTYFFAAPLLMMAVCVPGTAQTTQSATNPPVAPQPKTTTATASAIMQPSLNDVLRALDDVEPERWKTSGTMRQETTANIDSIRHDLTNTLPLLLATADGAPDSVVEVLPVYRNIDALYDVLLRVTETGRLSAPREQVSTLERALAGLEDGRRALGERLQAAAVAREQRVHTLEAAARAAAAAPKPAPAICPTVTHTTHTARRRTRKKTPAKKPAASSSSTGQQSGTASHQ